jgi:hypothetical protein
MTEPPRRPQRPQFPATDEAKPRRGSWVTVIVALMLVVGSFVSMMVMPLVGYAPLIVLALFAFAALHYFTWGWWLSKIIRDGEAEESQRSDKP